MQSPVNGGRVAQDSPAVHQHVGWRAVTRLTCDVADGRHIHQHQSRTVCRRHELPVHNVANLHVHTNRGVEALTTQRTFVEHCCAN